MPNYRNALAALTVTLGLWSASPCSSYSFYAQDSDYRTWHSAKGGFKVEAELLDVRDGKVQLRKKDGKTTWLELEKLSLADIRYVKGVLSEASNLDNVNSPARPKAKRSESSPVADSNADKGEATKQTDAPAMDADNLDADNETDGGKVEVDEEDPLHDILDADHGADTLVAGRDAESKSTQKVFNPFAGMRDLQYPLSASSALQITLTSRPSPFALLNSYSTLDAINLKTGKPVGSLPIAGGKFAISDDGTLVANAAGFPQVISIYEVKTGRIRREIKLENNQQATEVYFSAPNELAVLIFGSPTTLCRFDIKSGKPKDEIKLSTSSQRVVFNPVDDRIAYQNSANSLTISHLKTGEISRTVTAPQSTKIKTFSIDEFNFSPDGKTIGILFGGFDASLYIYDLEKGRSVGHFAIVDKSHKVLQGKGLYSGSAITWLPENRGWLIYGSHFVDPKLGGPLWSEKLESGSSVFFRTFIDNKRVLSVVRKSGGSVAEVTDFPWEELTQSQTFVAEGGVAEDSKLPPLKPTPGKLAKPILDNLQIGPYAGTKLDQKKNSVNFSLPIDASTVGHDFHMSSQPSNKLLLVKNPLMGETGESHLWELNNAKAPSRPLNLDLLRANHTISPDGKWIAGAASESLSRVDVIDLETGKHVLGFRPPVRRKELDVRISEIRWLTNDILAVHDNSNTIDVWRMPALEHLYSVPTLGNIGLFPSGTKFVHFTLEGLKVREIETGKLLGLLESLPLTENFIPITLKVSPDESKCLAESSDGESTTIAIWDLTTSKLLKKKSFSSLAIIQSTSERIGAKVTSFDAFGRRLKGGEAPSRIEGIKWTNTDNLLLISLTPGTAPNFSGFETPMGETACLYDWQEERVVWNYRTPVQLKRNTPDSQIWYQTFNGGSLALTGISVPSAAVQAAIGKVAPAKPVLPKDSLLAISVDAVISGEKVTDGLMKLKIEDELKKLLDSHKINIVDRAPLKLSVNVTRKAPKYERSVRPIGRGRSSQVTLTPVSQDTTPVVLTAELTDISDAPLWSQSSVLELSEVADSDSTDVEEATETPATSPWEKIADWINKKVDPSKMYDTSNSEGAGLSELSTTGKETIRKR